jgi:hypothetical protein
VLSSYLPRDRRSTKADSAHAINTRGPIAQGAHPGAVAEYATHARAHQSEIPTTPKEAREYWAAYEQEHPEYIVTARTNFARQLAERMEAHAQAHASSKRERCYDHPRPVLHFLCSGRVC